MSEQTKLEPDIVERLEFAASEVDAGQGETDTPLGDADLYREAKTEITRLRAERPGWADLGALLHNVMPAKAANRMTMAAEFEQMAVDLRAALGVRLGWAKMIEATTKMADATEELIALAETTFPSSDLLDARIALDEWRALQPSVAKREQR